MKGKIIKIKVNGNSAADSQLSNSGSFQLPSVLSWLHSHELSHQGQYFKELPPVSPRALTDSVYMLTLTKLEDKMG